MRERYLAAPVAAFLALAPSVAFADAVPPPGMLPNAANAQLPAARNSLGAGAGNGVNVVTDYGADPTGTADSTTAFQNAVNAACNVPAAGYQTRQVFIPAGYYIISSTIDYYGSTGCDVAGQGTMEFASTPPNGTLISAGATMTTGDIFRNRGLGWVSFHDLSITTPYEIALNMGTTLPPPMTGGVFYVRPAAGGSGYAVNDTITLTGGTFSIAAVLKVTHITGGAVDGVGVQNSGAYTVIPSAVAGVAQGSSSGGGTGATFNVVFGGNAAISLSGPEAVITASAASGATVLSVDRVSASFAGGVGSNVQVELDNGTYQLVAFNASTPTTITLASGLTFPASAGRHVYPQYGYLQRPSLSNVAVSGVFDGVFIDNAVTLSADDLFAVDYLHDGIIEFNGASPDAGAGHWQVEAWDFSLGTSNAGIEQLAGGALDLSGSSVEGSNYSVLLNSYFGPTGTLLLSHGSFEEAAVCSVRLHQSVGGIEFGNVSVTDNEFSNLTHLSAQHLCIDTGTPNTAPKWVRNVVFSANHANDYITASTSDINIQDGDNVVVEGNAFNNNNQAGPTGISVGGNATHVVEAGNQFANFPSGKYGPINESSLDPWETSAPPWTAYTPALTCLSGALTTAAASGRFRTIGNVVDVEADITITTAGTCIGVVFSLPVNAASTKYVIAGREIAATGHMLQGFVLSGNASMEVVDTNNSNVAASGYELVLTGVYESP